MTSISIDRDLALALHQKAIDNDDPELLKSLAFCDPAAQRLLGQKGTLYKALENCPNIIKELKRNSAEFAFLCQDPQDHSQALFDAVKSGNWDSIHRTEEVVSLFKTPQYTIFHLSAAVQSENVDVFKYIAQKYKPGKTHGFSWLSLLMLLPKNNDVFFEVIKEYQNKGHGIKPEGFAVLASHLHDRPDEFSKVVELIDPKGFLTLFSKNTESFDPCFEHIPEAYKNILWGHKIPHAPVFSANDQKRLLEPLKNTQRPSAKGKML